MATYKQKDVKKLNYNELLTKLKWLYGLVRLPLPSGAEPKHRQVFHYLAMLCNYPMEARCTPSHAYLSKVTGYGATTIKGILTDLGGWDLVTKTARHNNSNVYRLHWDGLEGGQELVEALKDQPPTDGTK